jgi:predicted HAD superfamily Cof-like phosphohydrolase
MHKAQAAVREFHRQIMHSPTSPAEPALRNPEKRAALSLEESFETAVAFVGIDRAKELMAWAVSKQEAKIAIDSSLGEPSLERALDGSCDMIYVAYGHFEEIGVDGEGFFDEVHAANMRKRDIEHLQVNSELPIGKACKPEGWVGPDIAGALARVVAYHKKGEVL